MKTSIFDMNFILPPLVEMHEVGKDMPTGSGCRNSTDPCMQENTMKTSIFDMNFVLPPVVEIHEVVKAMPMATATCDWGPF